MLHLSILQVVEALENLLLITVNLMSYSFVNFVTFVVSTERKCRICDNIVLNKLTSTHSQRIRALQKHETFYKMSERPRADMNERRFNPGHFLYSFM
jgi:GTPase Era involved in 16S rRNA processing